MATTHTQRWLMERDGVTQNYSKDYSNSGSVSISGETVADAQTDQLFTVTLDVSACTSFFIVAENGALTIETNSGSSPADTLTMVAGVPYVWTSDTYDAFKLGTDVTALYFTNASGATVTVNMEAIFDGSP